MNQITGGTFIDVFQLISLIGGLSTIILGVIAIWLSLYFYRRSNELNNLMTDMLSRIESSSRVTETTSASILQPVVDTVLAIVKDSTTNRIDSLSPQIMQRVVKKIDDFAFEAKTDKEKSAARQAVIDELEALLGSFRHEVAELGGTSALQKNSVRPILSPSSSNVSTGWSTANWTAFLRKIKNMEEKNKFLSVKWLRETKFRDNPEAQEMLQVALDKGLLSEYYVDNPRNPSFPTLACKLNREKDFVVQVFEFTKK